MYEVCVLNEVPWREMAEAKIEIKYIMVLKSDRTS